LGYHHLHEHLKDRVWQGLRFYRIRTSTMYILTNTIAKPLAPSSQGTQLNAGELTFAELFSTYRQILLILRNEFVPRPVTLDAEAIRARVGGLDITVNAFLLDNGNPALPTQDWVPAILKHAVRYNDAFKAR